MPVIYDNYPLSTPAPHLDGTAYIGVATSEVVVGQAQRSVYAIYRRPGDEGPVFGEFTKGAEARQHFAVQFMKSQHSWLLYLDGDMLFPVDTLERLRCHGLPCVSGLYFRRTYDLVLPIWYEDDPTFCWPMMPFRETPHSGRLYRLGGTGFGCWLIHRSAFEAVTPLLKGEPYVWQDDMDVWPYTLSEIRAGRETLRPLRGTKDQVGADIRLSFFIRQAGIPIWGDPAVACGHYVQYPLGLQNWEALEPRFRQAQARGTEVELAQIRQQVAADTARALGEDVPA
ncbi:MAG TPA: hypothetical protein VIV12_12985 [Streptosporangiaceae bacterium]